MPKVKEKLISFFSALVIIWCYNLPLLADLVFWQPAYWVDKWVCNLVLFMHLQGRFDVWVMTP